ncbi:hypothetical protein LZ30DRAFT_694838 [Colletotrichum cereale]|nr:hypothetical protein LZ30DRAFT_694838 [Colletotrichum cereale]
MSSDADRGDGKELLEKRRKKTGHTALHFATTTRQEPRKKLATLKAVVDCAQHGLGLLELEDAYGKTPPELAEEIPWKIGLDLLEALGRFQEDTEVGSIEARLRQGHGRHESESSELADGGECCVQDSVGPCLIMNKTC